MTVREKEGDPASIPVKTFPSWGQWDELELIFGPRVNQRRQPQAVLLRAHGHSSQICCSACKEIIFGLVDFMVLSKYRLASKDLHVFYRLILFQVG